MSQYLERFGRYLERVLSEEILFQENDSETKRQILSKSQWSTGQIKFTSGIKHKTELVLKVFYGILN